jgi:regulator of replication initiation timing
MNPLLIFAAALFAVEPLPESSREEIRQIVTAMQNRIEELMDRLATIGTEKTAIEKENSGIKVDNAELKINLDAAHKSLKDATIESRAMQTAFDNLTIERDNAVAGEKAEGARKWYWMKWCFSLVIIDLLLLGWIFKKPLARLCGIPIP